MTRIKAPPKECEQCGELFKIREKEGYDDWITRRFCSRSCSTRYRLARDWEEHIPLRKTKPSETDLGTIHVRQRQWTESGPVIWRIIIRKDF
jgi:hypothetical protein